MIIFKNRLPVFLYCCFSFIFLIIIGMYNNSDVSVYIKYLEYKNLFDFILLISLIYYLDGKLFFGKSYNIFIIIFTIFHLGIPISNIFTFSDNYFNEYIGTWYYTSYTINSLTAINSFLLFYFSSGILNINKKSINTYKNNIFYKINYISLFFLVFLWIATVYFIFGLTDYSDIYSENKNNFLTVVLIFFPQFISFSFLILISKKEYFYKSWMVFLVWALFAFSLGIRGPVLFPLSLSLAVLVSVYKYKITMTKFFLILIVLCFSITYKFFSRSDISFEIWDINPLMAFQEMGSSLRPVNEVNYWLDTGIYKYQYGLTYIAPIERAFIGVFPLYEIPIGIEDTRLMNVAITKNAGPYGFSILAESYINFGFIGVSLLAILISFILRKIDLVMSKITEYPFYILLLLAIFFHIRQAFVGTWGVLIYLSMYIIAMMFIAMIFRKVQE